MIDEMKLTVMMYTVEPACKSGEATSVCARCLMLEPSTNCEKTGGASAACIERKSAQTKETHEAGDHVLRGHHVVCSTGAKGSVTISHAAVRGENMMSHVTAAAERTVRWVLQEVVDHLQWQGTQTLRSQSSRATTIWCCLLRAAPHA
jgi:hypothetical protein